MAGNPFEGQFGATPTTPNNNATPTNPFMGQFGATPKAPTTPVAPTSPIQPVTPAVAPQSTPAIAPTTNATPNNAPTPTATLSPLESALQSQIASGAVTPEQATALRSQANGFTPPPQTNTAQPIQNAASAVGSYFKNLFTHPNQTVKDTTPAIANDLGENAIVHPIQTAKQIGQQMWTSSGQVLGNLVSAAVQFKSDVLSGGNAPNALPSTGRDAATKISSTLNLLQAILSVPTYAVGETYNIASELPIIKPAAQAIGIGFNAAGQIVSFAGDKLLDALPIPQSDKDELLTSVNSVSGFLGQVLLGGYIYETITDHMVSSENPQLKTSMGITNAPDLNHQYGPTPEDMKFIIQDVQDKAQQINDDPDVKNESPESPASPVKPSENEGDETVPPKNNVKPVQNSPTIDLATDENNQVRDIIPPKPTMEDTIVQKLSQPKSGQKVTDITPPELIAKDTPVSVKGSEGNYKMSSDTGAKEVTVVNKDTGNEEVVPRDTVSEVQSSEDEIVKKKRVIGALKPVEGTGEFSNFKLSKRVEANAIEQGLADSLGDLPGSKSINMADQAKKVADFINEDPEKARSVAMGEANAPKGILPMAVYKAFTTLALDDPELAKDLANSQLAGQARTMGQNISALRGINPEDPVQAIKDLQDAREEATKEKAATEAKKASDSIKQATADRVSGKTKVDWPSFIKSLGC
jgi:hypothetical protein